MADISYNELVKRIAHKLALVADSEDVPAEYVAIIKARCQSVQQQLDCASVCNFHVEGGLEEAYSDPFADLVAAECADVFALPEPQYSRVASQKFGLPVPSFAERRLKKMFITSKLKVVTDVTVI
jgi:hypothetical protein